MATSKPPIKPPWQPEGDQFLPEQKGVKPIPLIKKYDVYQTYDVLRLKGSRNQIRLWLATTAANREQWIIDSEDGLEKIPVEDGGEDDTSYSSGNVLNPLLIAVSNNLDIAVQRFTADEYGWASNYSTAMMQVYDFYNPRRGTFINTDTPSGGLDKFVEFRPNVIDAESIQLSLEKSIVISFIQITEQSLDGQGYLQLDKRYIRITPNNPVLPVEYMSPIAQYSLVINGSDKDVSTVKETLKDKRLLWDDLGYDPSKPFGGSGTPPMQSPPGSGSGERVFLTQRVWEKSSGGNWTGFFPEFIPDASPPEPDTNLEDGDEIAQYRPDRCFFVKYVEGHPETPKLNSNATEYAPGLANCGYTNLYEPDGQLHRLLLNKQSSDGFFDPVSNARQTDVAWIAWNDRPMINPDLEFEVKKGAGGSPQDYPSPNFAYFFLDNYAVYYANNDVFNTGEEVEDEYFPWELQPISESELDFDVSLPDESEADAYTKAVELLETFSWARKDKGDDESGTGGGGRTQRLEWQIQNPRTEQVTFNYTVNLEHNNLDKWFDFDADLYGDPGSDTFAFITIQNENQKIAVNNSFRNKYGRIQVQGGGFIDGDVFEVGDTLYATKVPMNWFKETDGNDNISGGSFDIPEEYSEPRTESRENFFSDGVGLEPVGDDDGGDGNDKSDEELNQLYIFLTHVRQYSYITDGEKAVDLIAGFMTDSPRIVAIEQALNATEYATYTSTKDGKEKRRVDNLGSRIERTSRILGDNRLADGTSYQPKDPQKIDASDPDDSDQTVEIPEPYRFARWGLQEEEIEKKRLKVEGNEEEPETDAPLTVNYDGIIYEFMSNEFVEDESTGEPSKVRQGGYALVHNIPQLIRQILDDFDKALGLQEAGAFAIRSSEDVKVSESSLFEDAEYKPRVATYEGLASLVMENSYMLSAISSRASTGEITGLTNQAMIQELLAITGLPISSKSFKADIGVQTDSGTNSISEDKPTSVYYPGFQETAPRFFELIVTILQNIAPLLGKSYTFDKETQEEIRNMNEDELENFIQDIKDEVDQQGDS